MPHFERPPKQEAEPSDADIIAAFESGENLDHAQDLFRAREIAQLERAQKADTISETFAIEIEIAQLYGAVGLVHEAQDRLKRIIADVAENEALEDAAHGGETGLREVHVDALQALRALPTVQ